ncbi:MAG TPA: hypothetical protein VN878_07730 [Usitatibacter sp.]|nr:hypothetical protein [Usitatibacter sp.]
MEKPAPQPAANLEALRHALLDLHKALVEAQRARYEREHGRIETSARMLQLLLEDPEFEWLRALSALIAQLDEWMESNDPAREEEGAIMVATLRSLVQPAGPNASFSAPYWEFVEAVPDVLVAHVKLRRLLGSEGKDRKA